MSDCTRDTGVRPILMILRRVGLLLVTETERELGMESSVLTKQERERRKREGVSPRLAPPSQAAWGNGGKPDW